jgi:hypothetical protein
MLTIRPCVHNIRLVYWSCCSICRLPLGSGARSQNWLSVLGFNCWLLCRSYKRTGQSSLVSCANVLEGCFVCKRARRVFWTGNMPSRQLCVRVRVDFRQSFLRG